MKMYTGLISEQDSKFHLFLQALSNSFDQLESEKSSLHCSLEQTERQLKEVNKKLKEESTENAVAFNQLRELIDMMSKDGNELPTSSGKKPNIVELAGIIRKETEKRKRAEEKQIEYLHNLEKINLELDQFAYIVSHDLKAPLRAIASLADWIKEDSGEILTQESKENLELLRGRVTRMEQLIHGILAYSKAGKVTSEKSIVNVQELLNNIIDSLNPPKNISIQIPTDLPNIETEVIKLQQVFGNLISNCIKYMDKEKGNVKIGWYQLDDACQFFVEDNGPGIEKEYHERIFLIFQTLSARDEIESTGIGLSIVKKIIEEQGGKIWVESIPGSGSKFIFTWPSEIKIKNKTLA